MSSKKIRGFAIYDRVEIIDSDGCVTDTNLRIAKIVDNQVWLEDGRMFKRNDGRFCDLPFPWARRCNKNDDLRYFRSSSDLKLKDYVRVYVCGQNFVYTISGIENDGRITLSSGISYDRNKLTWICDFDGVREINNQRTYAAIKIDSEARMKILNRLYLSSKVTDRGCVIFKRENYPKIKHNGRYISVHRAMCEISIGRKLNRDEVACHLCDNPMCINHDHVFIGSTKDNVHDMLRKRRNCFKIPIDQSPHIIDLLQCGRFCTKEVARMYGVSVTCITYQKDRILRAKSIGIKL